MKRLLAIALMSCAAATAQEGARSGHATAQWLVAEDNLEGVVGNLKVRGHLKTVIRLGVDEGWHVYWYNPGEAGMPTSVELKLPEGWKGSALKHPTPKKFKTGELHGFGHEGTVDYLLNLTAPEDFKGDAELEATVSWLTCNDEACIPGEIPLKLKVMDGKVVGAKTVEPEAYEFITQLFPVAAPTETKLKLLEGDKQWELMVENPGPLKLNPARTEVFIETQELVPASAKVRFRPEAELWVARCPKGEYAPDNPDECAILLVQDGKRAVRLEWKR